MLTSPYELQEFQAVARVEAHVRKASCGHDAKVEFGHYGLRVEAALFDERKQAYAVLNVFCFAIDGDLHGNLVEMR
jgi:hypothetical protein